MYTMKKRNPHNILGSLKVKDAAILPQDTSQASSPQFIFETDQNQQKQKTTNAGIIKNSSSITRNSFSSPSSNNSNQLKIDQSAVTARIDDLLDSASPMSSFMIRNERQKSNQQNESPQKDQLRLKSFKKLRDLGRGAYGICGLYRDERSRLSQKVVIKRVSLECKSEGEQRQISYEASLLKKLSHPNIIRLHDSFVEAEQLCIVMEYLEGGTLERMIQERKGIKMGQDLVLYYFTQITLAIDYMHAMKILHRDIKTQNIFLNRKMTIVKVGDFGISKELNSKCPQASTVIGTPNYLSPEIICAGRSYGAKSDIWSMGCVLYELVELKKAYEGESLSSLLIRIARGEHGQISSTVTECMRKLINSLLNIDEQKRPSTTEILRTPIVLRKWMEIHINLGRIEPDIEMYTKETHIEWGKGEKN